MKREPSPREDLLSLLDEWQPEPPLSAQFDARLERRIAVAAAMRRDHPCRYWWQRSLETILGGFPRALAVAALVLLVALGAVLYSGSNDAEPGPVPTVQSAQLDPVVRDLQTLDRDGELLDHLDFLSAPMAPAVPHVQDQD